MAAGPPSPERRYQLYLYMQTLPSSRELCGLTPYPIIAGAVVVLAQLSPDYDALIVYLVIPRIIA